ncbi:PREDICTED: membrane-associated progesterone receptor component 1-like [Papilio polytes]|uniref:Membrane steroid binding protein n=1 Tax=Papilio polytes TaxID=76194 RepID=I4DMH8_PAPPL|nr:membrane-associated progesterone receptor component 1-like [Papilio polytes]BAM19118.1 membrane steroid binding protein [Papilio polytes]
MTSTEEAPSSFWDELTSPLNLVLVAVILYLVYKILRSHFESEDTTAAPPPPPMKKLRKDLTTAELKKYDGTGSDGRVLLAVNGVIFDVTRGKRFYGPGGPYSAFAGKDATRGLATGSVSADDKEWDDVSDLNADEISSAKEWEEQFREKYDIVGRLLKPGETPNKYSDDETEDKKEL